MRSQATLRVLVTLLAATSMAVSGCGEGARVEQRSETQALPTGRDSAPVVVEAPPPTDVTVEDRLSEAIEFSDDIGARLDPPRREDRIAVPKRHVETLLQTVAPQPTGGSDQDHRVILARYSNDVYGAIGEDGRVEPHYRDHLVWAAIYEGTEPSVRGGVDPQGRPAADRVAADDLSCSFVVVVGAMTGDYLMGFEDCEPR